MIEERGRIVALQGNQAWVQTLRQNACQSCRARSGCGQRALHELSGGKARQVRVDNALQAQVGDQVLLGIGETALLRASVLVYLVPVLGLLAGALVGDRVAGLGDGGTILAGALGMALAFLLVRMCQRHAITGQFRPVLLKVLHMGLSHGHGPGLGQVTGDRNFFTVKR
jgi:sigma-E factor negative regulatory protein RseC